MALTPDDITSRAFRPSLWGVNREEVQSFLETVASDYSAALKKSGEVESRMAQISARLEKAEELLRAAGGAQAAPGDPERLPAHEPAGPQDDEAAYSEADRVDELGRRVADVIRSAQEAAESMWVTADAEANEKRRVAEHQASLLRQAADDYAGQVRRQGERIMADARQQALVVLNEAHGDAGAIRARAERYVQEVKAAAELEASTTRQRAREDAERHLNGARHEVASLMAVTRQSVERLRADELQVRTWMESAVAWMVRSLDAPPSEVSGPRAGELAANSGQRWRAQPDRPAQAGPAGELADTAEPGPRPGAGEAT